MTTDLKDDVKVFIASTLKDLDDFYDVLEPWDKAYKEGQMDLIGRLLEIVARYEESYR